jgi:hypothetical protein
LLEQLEASRCKRLAERIVAFPFQRSANLSPDDKPSKGIEERKITKVPLSWTGELLQEGLSQKDDVVDDHPPKFAKDPF